MKKEEFCLNESSPLLIELKEDKEEENEGFGYLQKDVWSLICRFLGEKEICNLSLLNKKFNELINTNKLIWIHLIQRDSQLHPLHPLPLKEYYFPKSIALWKVEKHLIKVIPSKKFNKKKI